MEDQPRSHPIKFIGAALLLIISAVIVYYPSLKIPFLLDDYGKIIRNPDIKSLDNIPSRLIYPYGSPPEFHRNDPSRPLTYLTLTFNYHFSQLEPYGYHLVNIALHVAVVLLVFALASLVFPLIGIKGLMFPFLSALLFSVHPINVNVVSYVMGRAASLAACFYVLAVILFIKARQGAKWGTLVSAACFVLALASNQLSLTLPALLLITDFCFFSEADPRRTLANWKQHSVYWGLLAVYFGLRLAYFGKLGDLEASAQFFGRKSYFLTQLVVLWKYAGMTLAPARLSFEHSFAAVDRLTDPRLLTALGGYAILFSLLWKGLKSSPKIAYVGVFGVMWFFITISPTSSFFPTTAWLAENRVYLPFIGLCVLFVYGAYAITRRIFRESASRVAMIFLLGGYCVVLGGLTLNRNILYQDPVRIWSDILQKYPNFERAHKNLAVEYYKLGNFKQMSAEAEKAVALDPDDFDARNNLAASYFNLGRFQDALAAYQEIVKQRPDYAPAYSNMGMAYEQLKDRKAATSAYETAIRLNPMLIEPLNNLGGIYLETGRVQEAKAMYEAALRIDPNNEKILQNYRRIAK